MPTVAVVGAGPGLGLSIARRFGPEQPTCPTHTN
jgi:hypothetical protein